MANPLNRSPFVYFVLSALLAPSQSFAAEGIELVGYGARQKALDSGAKRNGLSEADFHVFAKLGEKGLERGLETEAFSRSKVCGEDNLLNVVV